MTIQCNTCNHTHKVDYYDEMETIDCPHCGLNCHADIISK